MHFLNLSARGYGLSVVVAFLLTPVCLMADGASAEDSQTFGEVVDVELINLRVWVSDSKGRSVFGLNADDFELEVDGQPIEVTHFSAIEQASVADGRSENVALLGPDEGNRGGEVEDPAPTRRSDQEASLVVYLDELHLQPQGRKRVLKDLRHLLDLEEISADRVLIMRQGLELLTEAPFGSTKEQLLAAVDRLKTPYDAVGKAAWEKQLAIDHLWREWEIARQVNAQDPCRFFVRNAYSYVSSYSQEASRRTLITARHLVDTGRFLGGVRGVKALLYIGDVLDLEPGEDLVSLVSSLCPSSEVDRPSLVSAQNLTKDFDRLSQSANASRVTLYTLQSGGLKTSSLGGPEQATTQGNVISGFDLALRNAERGGFEQLASQTGGRAFLNRNRFRKQLTSMAQDLVSYYSLGFPPPPGDQQARQKIDVKVKRRGLKVRHRDTYRQKAAEEQMSDQVLSAIYLGMSENPLEIRLASGSLEEQEGGVFSLPLRVRLPASEITYLPTAEGSLSSLEVLVTRRSSDAHSPPPSIRRFRFAKPEDVNALVDLPVPLRLSAGVHVLGVGVRDLASGEASYVSTTVEVQSATTPGSVTQE